MTIFRGIRVDGLCSVFLKGKYNCVFGKTCSCSVNFYVCC